MSENETEVICWIKDILKRKKRKKTSGHRNIRNRIKTLLSAFRKKEIPEQDPPV